MTAPVAGTPDRPSILVRLTTDDPRGAMLTGALLFWASALAVLITTFVDMTARGATSRDDIMSDLGLAAAIAIAGWLIFGLRDRAGRILSIVLPVGGAASALAAHLVTEDASVGAQFIFALAVLYAAAHLRDPGIAVVTGVAIISVGVTAWSLLPGSEAFSDTVSSAAILTAIAVGLASARRLHARGLSDLQSFVDTDTLTGANHRHVLDDALRAALASARGDGTALITVDVDEFKAVNDTFGHQTGDAALRHVAEVLRQNVRPHDIVSRMGGDEFAVLLPDCTQRSAVDRAERVLRDLRARPIAVGETLVALSVSVGVAHAPTDATDVEAMYGAADRALYRAKHAGRARVESGR